MYYMRRSDRCKCLLCLVFPVAFRRCLETYPLNTNDIGIHKHKLHFFKKAVTDPDRLSFNEGRVISWTLLTAANHWRLHMGKRTFLFVLMFGVVSLLVAYGSGIETPQVMLAPSPIPLMEWGMDNPTDDTIRYDDTSPNSYVLVNGYYYPSVRFTPLLQYELQAAYLQMSVITAVNNFDVWVTGDLGGTPDPSNIIEVETGFVPATGLMQVDFDTFHTFAANQDFHIVWGPVDALLWEAVPPAGFAASLDQSADGLLRSYYASAWPAVSYIYLWGYDWRTRAGGTYAAGTVTDLAVSNVDNDSLKYFLCEGESVTFRALIENVQTDTVATYDIKWVVRNEAGTTVDSIQATYSGPLDPGTDTTQVAPSAWTGSVSDEYIVTCTVTATGDVEPANNVRLFEQQVYDPTVSTLLDYIIPNYQVNLVLDPSEGRAMRYDACSFPLEITHLEVEGDAAGTARVRIYGDDGLDAPSGVMFDTLITLTAGMNTIPVSPSVPVASGPFYVAFIYADATTPNMPLDGDPSAGGNLTMPQVIWETADGGATWSATSSAGDHPLSARVIAFGGTIRDIRVDWMTFPGFFGPGSDPFEGQIQVTNNGTEADTFDVSLIIEDTTFARSVVFSETQTVTNLAVGDSAALTYGSYNFPGIGEYILTAEAVVLGDVTPGDNVLMAEHQTCSYPSELTYDDGDFENGWAFFDPGNFWGARFDPPFLPCKITDMRLNFSTVPTGYDNARVQIIDDDQTTLLYDVEDASVDTGWNTYSLPDVLVMDGFFYAGTEWVTGAPNAPYFSTDTNEPISYMARQRIITPTDTTWYYDTEEAGVRVTLDAAVMSPIVITRTGGSRNLDILLSWTFAGTVGETWYFIYESNAPYGTYTLVDSVAHPSQSWIDINLPEVKKFYYVTFGDASGSRDSTLPGQYLWQPFEMTVSGNSAIEPGVIRAPRNVADRR